MTDREEKTIGQFLKDKNDDFMKFGELFVGRLTDETLINSLAEKDLEKLAKVFKLVFDKLGEEGRQSEQGRLLDIINAVREIEVGKEDG